MGNMSGSYGSHYTLRLDTYVLSQDIANNRSTIRADLYLDFDGSSYWATQSNTTYGSIYINGNTSNKSIGSISFSSGVAGSVYLGTHDVVVDHYADGTCNAVLVRGTWDTNTTRIGSGSVDAYVKPNTIPRYANITNFTVSKRDQYSVQYNWTADANCDWAWYSINNGSTWSDLPPSNIVSGLSPNTSYNFKLKIRRTDSQLTTESGTYTQSTYPNTVPTIWLSNKTVNSITVNSGCNVAVSSTQYRINGGNYQDSSTFTGLSPNTTYNIEVKKVSTDGGIVGTASINIATYDIAKYTSIPETINFGDNITITKSNPSGATNDLAIEIAGQQILVRYSISDNTYTFNITEEEWDTLYKALGNSNSITINFVLGTYQNGNSYWDNITRTATLTGNKQTGHIKLNGSWKRTKHWINVNGTWRRAVRWINVNGTWKRCI